MKTQSLTRFLASLPPSRGKTEQLRQERILKSTEERAKSIEEDEQSEMQALREKSSLSLAEQIRLEFLQRTLPDTEGPSLD